MARWSPSFLRRRPFVPVLRLQGVIAASGSRGTLSAAALSPIIARAFDRGAPVAVALVINSPGGSPVQSALIAAQIRRLADEKGLRVHAFVEDVAASGGYWLAAAADDVWVDASSITGSIGVISAGFGFAGLLERCGIDRRVHTAGEDKSLLDPFRPERAADVARLEAIQARIHDHFIAHVRARRGDRLAAERDLFTGDVFVGGEAVEAGLADGIDHLVPRLKRLYGDDVRLRQLSVRKPLLQRLVPGIVEDAAAAIEARAAWARFGL